MTTEFWIMIVLAIIGLGSPLIGALALIIFNRLIMARLDKLELAIESGLGQCMTKEACAIYHDGHKEVHKREDQDINNVANIARSADEIANSALRLAEAHK